MGNGRMCICDVGRSCAGLDHRHLWLFRQAVTSFDRLIVTYPYREFDADTPCVSVRLRLMLAANCARHPAYTTSAAASSAVPGKPATSPRLRPCLRSTMPVQRQRTAWHHWNHLRVESNPGSTLPTWQAIPSGPHLNVPLRGDIFHLKDLQNLGQWLAFLTLPLYRSYCPSAKTRAHREYHSLAHVGAKKEDSTYACCSHQATQSGCAGTATARRGARRVGQGVFCAVSCQALPRARRAPKSS